MVNVSINLDIFKITCPACGYKFDIAGYSISNLRLNKNVPMICKSCNEKINIVPQK
jgi:hypothetical protein